METRKCKSCEQEFTEWVEFCPHCGEAIEGYSKPAGFWIRVGAHIIDILVFIPIMVLGVWNAWHPKSTVILILVSLPGLIYKPFMESFYGATLGKMSCKIKVIDENGNKLSLLNAYIRFFPFLLHAGVTLASTLVLYSSPEFQSAESMQELAEAQQKTGILSVIGYVALVFILIDCICVAFTYRKRAIHDMMAESYCVYKEP
ncbi:MAG: RDD family protein [Phycisphaerales bacterium]|jgi:uncharacterized RDD family membrane protein YckC